MVQVKQKEKKDLEATAEWKGMGIPEDIMEEKRRKGRKATVE